MFDIKKRLIFLALPALILLILGCETCKGIATGAAEGAKKDWQAAERVDAWMRKNLW